MSAPPPKTYELDVRGLTCPLPILRAKKKLETIRSGDILNITATDPGAVADFETFARQTGHALLESTTTEGEYFFKLQKG